MKKISPQLSGCRCCFRCCSGYDRLRRFRLQTLASSASSAASSEAASSAAAAELTTVEAGKLTMATNATFPPYEMTTDAGEFEGIDVDTAKAIAEKLGLELQIDDMDFDAALLSVQQGKADIVMAGVTVTDERKAVMDFSDSYATGIQSIIVPNDSDIALPTIWQARRSAPSAAPPATSTAPMTSARNAVVAYDNGLTAVQALNNGQVDAVVIDNAPATEYVAANPRPEGAWIPATPRRITPSAWQRALHWRTLSTRLWRS